MKNPQLALLVAPLLAACPQEEHPATVRIEAGRLVFDGDRSDCIVRLHVDPEGADAYPVWQLSSAMPLSNDAGCPLRFPIAYVAAPPRVSAWPDGPAPALEPGRRYFLRVEGMNYRHSAEFTAP